MLATIIFYTVMLLPPFIVKWVDGCNENNEK